MAESEVTRGIAGNNRRAAVEGTEIREGLYDGIRWWRNVALLIIIPTYVLWLMFEIKYRSDTTTPGSAGAGRGVRSSIVTVAPPKAPTCTNVNSLSEISGKDGHYCVHLKAGVDSGIYRPPGGRKMDITINAPGEVSYFDSKNNLIDKPVLVAGTGDNLRFLPGWAAFSVKLAVDGTVTLLLEKI